MLMVAAEVKHIQSIEVHIITNYLLATCYILCNDDLHNNLYLMLDTFAITNK